MKRSITILICIACFSFSSLYAQNEKVIGEKSKKVIGEKIIGEKGADPQNRAILAKYKNEIERYYSAYIKRQAEAESIADGLRKKLEEAMKTLEAQDKMGNFEIQRLMSEFNQAEQLSSQVQKKREETKKSVISKL